MFVSIIVCNKICMEFLVVVLKGINMFFFLLLLLEWIFGVWFKLIGIYDVCILFYDEFFFLFDDDNNKILMYIKN